MGRILAIDYGKKRTGIAVTDPLQIIATGLTTVETNKLKSFLKEYSSQNELEKFVIGLPRQMSGEYSESYKYIKPFSIWLQKEFPDKEVIFVDERFTSKLAMQAIIAGGVKKSARRDKALVDKVSATIILQTYLENL
ncbi:MAG: Holliday junction resolvase RuvX [Rikenellaceae bacterium]